MLNDLARSIAQVARAIEKIPPDHRRYVLELVKKELEGPGLDSEPQPALD